MNKFIKLTETKLKEDKALIQTIPIFNSNVDVFDYEQDVRDGKIAVEWVKHLPNK